MTKEVVRSNVLGYLLLSFNPVFFYNHIIYYAIKLQLFILTKRDFYVFFIVFSVASNLNIH